MCAASQFMMEPCCSFPQTVTCLFSDSGSDRCRGPWNVFASLKRDFRAQRKCVCTVSAFISWGGEEEEEDGTREWHGLSCKQSGQEWDHPETVIDLANCPQLHKSNDVNLFLDQIIKKKKHLKLKCPANNTYSLIHMLIVEIRGHLRQFVRNNQLLPDCHRLPRFQSFKQHLLFDLEMTVREDEFDHCESWQWPSRADFCKQVKGDTVALHKQVDY